MRTLTYNGALKQATELHTTQQKRQRPYRHKPGQFLLTASFRDKSIDMHRVELVGKLTGRLTQKTIAYILDCSTSTVGKLVRIYYAKQAQIAGRE